MQALGSWADTEIRVDGVPRVVTGTDGWIAIFEIAPGQHVLEAVQPGYLTSRRSIDVVAGRVTDAGETLLIAGDAQPDNRIDLLDYLTVQNAFGACRDGVGYARRSDANGDGCVDIDDLAIVNENYGLIGPLPWAPIPIAPRG
jgi:hypothetical protein